MFKIDFYTAHSDEFRAPMDQWGDGATAADADALRAVIDETVALYVQEVASAGGYDVTVSVDYRHQYATPASSRGCLVYAEVSRMEDSTDPDSDEPTRVADYLVAEVFGDGADDVLRRL